MAKIEGVRVRNFKVLKDVALGRLQRYLDLQPLTPVTAVIGRNGVGKSTLFDAFGFLSDALKSGVEAGLRRSGSGWVRADKDAGADRPDRLPGELPGRPELSAHLLRNCHRRGHVGATLCRTGIHV